ncbi:MAG: RagB/SusD family nutrient uptake outer membrane protein [Chitinophagaceae bacterium]
MIKTINKIALSLAAAIVLFQSCSEKDLVELKPEFSLDALSNPSSMKQVEEVLIGAYAGFRDGNYYGSGSGTGGGWALMPDVLSDNLYETLESLANSRTMADWIYNSSTGQVSTFYSSPYVVVARANIVLRDVDKYTTTANQKQANRLKGQAYAMRALAHFDLLRYFATSYDRSSTTVLAMPYVKEFQVSTAVKPSRLTNKEYYDLLFADLAAALPLLSNTDIVLNPTTGLSRPYIDLATVYAIQARAYLYAGMWPEAITAATNAIGVRPLVNLNQTAFSGMYNQTNAGEIIWNVQFESGQSGPTFLAYFATSNRNYFRPALEVATTTGTSGLIQSNDIRYTAYFSTIGTGLALTKYKGKNAVVDGNANFIAFHTGEMYLIRAEAEAKNSQEGPALTDLNALRSARINGYVPLVGVTGQPLLDAIAIERRRELVGEGHRFFDLKRTTRTIVRGSTCGNTSVSPAGNCTLSSTAREWTMPIPESVIRANNNLKQNDGYN